MFHSLSLLKKESIKTSCLKYCEITYSKGTALSNNYLEIFYIEVKWAGGPDHKEFACNAEEAGDQGSIPGSGKFWRWEWQPTPVFMLGESHGQRKLVGYSPWGHIESNMT